MLATSPAVEADVQTWTSVIMQIDVYVNVKSQGPPGVIGLRGTEALADLRHYS